MHDSLNFGHLAAGLMVLFENELPNIQSTLFLH